MQTHELMKACLPQREDKRRVQRLLGFKNDSMMYKWCEDPDGSGRTNPVDVMDVILDHARLHYPTAAIQVVQHFEYGNVRALARSAVSRPLMQLVCDLQPETEKEATDAVRAFSAALRTIVLRGALENPRDLLHELEGAQRQLEVAAVMLRAAIEQPPTAAIATP